MTDIITIVTVIIAVSIALIIIVIIVVIIVVIVVVIIIIILITTRARTGILAGNHNSRVESSANGKRRLQKPQSQRLSQLIANRQILVLC